MTGQGQAQRETQSVIVAIELRTINSRYFKLNFRGSEGYMALEPRVESMLRKHVRRGAVNIGLKIERRGGGDQYRLNHEALSAYRQQLEKLYDKLHIASTVHLEPLLSLPGVVQEGASTGETLEQDWPVVQETLKEALASLSKMRQDEGAAMAADLEENRQTIRAELDAISKLAPTVVESYRERLTERMNVIMKEFGVELGPADVAREVAMFAERCDISEEVVRLGSHLEQFDAIMQLPESNGRKLEFVTQEMVRETNTIGSKANSAEINRHVIEIKAAIERMREMIQNVE